MTTSPADPRRKVRADRRAYDRAWRAKNRERVNAYHRDWRERNRGHVNADRRAWRAAHPGRHRAAQERYRWRKSKKNPITAQKHRIESQRDLAGHLRHRGNLHMHYRRIGGGFSWVLMYESRSVLCETERCTMIPLTIA